MVDDFRPSYANKAVCFYCSKVAIGSVGHDWIYGCGNRETDGYHVPLRVFDYKGAMNSFKGCEDFSPSGLPAHPDVHPILKEANSKAGDVPVDENATETAWEFGAKMEMFPHVTYRRKPGE
ncbi:MAG: hypothetical protein ISS93_03265 [Candidatus Aenigmarchaeota archaeon]|nr:hypothetical protein [Candidatus Aenigmarchaeota archaeon]